jgi:hypothetical protein
MFVRLKREPAAAKMEALPGWFARRAQNLPPAREVLERIPSGPVDVGSHSSADSERGTRRSA